MKPKFRAWDKTENLMSDVREISFFDKYVELESGAFRGFDECMRVLKPNGTLIFKWNEEQIKLSEVLKCFSQKPLLGNKRSKTHWLVFMKGADE